MFDVDTVRKDFPFIDNGRIYLDSSASSLTPEPVLKKMLEYYHGFRANVGRGVYTATRRATDEFESARKRIASLINAKPEEMIFVRNTSEALNLVAFGIGLKPGDRVIATVQEHHSNYIVWLRAKEKIGVDMRVINSDPEGNLDLCQLDRELERGARIVAVTHVSNVLGTKNPVEEIAKMAHERGALVVLDGAQSVPHMKVDVKRMGCDFLAFSGHKMCGPTGAGALFIRADLQDDVEPLCIGGGSIDDVGIGYYKLKKGPSRYEAGTPAIAEVIGMGEAAAYLQRIGMESISEYEERLTKSLLEGIRGINGVELHGPMDPKKKIGIASFNLGFMNPHDVALALDRSANVMVRSGHHCALPLMRDVLKCEQGSVRASVYFYNTEEEIETFINALTALTASSR
ncbi:MAG: cysteine desulfurase [Candidatus Verstraetearchaeota archaeon]|nr:cysteine desulfurase [Candidatus Verstraetearchaeota archaeon]